MPDGSIVLMGGANTGNDVWRSVDKGATWTQQTASAEWSGRGIHSSVSMPDGSIVLMGGYDDIDTECKNDVWRSVDNGVTWTLQTASAGWSPRAGHTSVAMPDSSIVLMGGADITTDDNKNDMWRSVDNGVTWTQLTASAGWSPRAYHTSVALADGSIVLMGGEAGGFCSDVWRFSPVGSSLQNPLHTYTATGIYPVTLQVYNTNGYSSLQKTDYITPAPVVAFNGTPVSGGLPLNVTFTDESAGNPTGWAWFFGDETYTEGWTEATASAGWSARWDHTSVAMPDGSIVLMGGDDGLGYKKDVWRSVDNGATWTEATASAG